MKIKTETVRYVRFSDLLFGYNKLAYDFCSYGSYDFTWGDNNLSLISRDRFRDAWDEFEPDEEDIEDYNAVMERIDNLPDEVYVDMEN